MSIAITKEEMLDALKEVQLDRPEFMDYPPVPDVYFGDIDESINWKDIPSDDSEEDEEDEDAPCSEMVKMMLGFDPDELDDLIAEGDTEDEAEKSFKGGAGSGRYPKGSGNDDGTAPKEFIFMSPNTDEDLKFSDAVARTKTLEQGKAEAYLKKMCDTLNIKSKCSTAIGDWSDGAENSVMQEISGDLPQGVLNYMAAIQGRTFNQKSVLAFKVNNTGKHTVHSIDTAETDMDSVRKTLTDNDLQFRTLIPTKSGTRIVMYDDGYDIEANVAKVAQHYKTTASSIRGDGNFIGHSISRQAAMAEYDTIIKEHDGMEHVATVIQRALKGEE